MDDRFALADIVVVEDSPADAELIRYVFDEAKIFNTLTVIDNGQDALDRLMQRKEYAHAARPDIVFLDLNLPGIGGKEILAQLKASGKGDIPIIILTGCETERSSAEQAGIPADCFLIKPLLTENLINLVRLLKDMYWGLISIKNQPPEAAA